MTLYFSSGAADFVLFIPSFSAVCVAAPRRLRGGRALAPPCRSDFFGRLPAIALRKHAVCFGFLLVFVTKEGEKEKTVVR